MAEYSKYADARCSFCKKNYREVGPLVEGPDGVFICYDCVVLAARIIEAELERRGDPLPDELVELPPRPPEEGIRRLRKGDLEI